MISGGACEAGALAYQALAQPETPGGGRHEKQAKSCGWWSAVGLFAIANEEDTSQSLAGAFCDPAALALWLKLIDEVGGYAGDECFEPLVPAVFLPIQGTVAFYYPAHIAGAMAAQDDGMLLGRIFSGV